MLNANDLLGLNGKRVVVLTPQYYYRGTISEITPNGLILTRTQIVYQAGDMSTVLHNEEAGDAVTLSPPMPMSLLSLETVTAIIECAPALQPQ
jgi:hypothetical protein